MFKIKNKNLILFAFTLSIIFFLGITASASASTVKHFGWSYESPEVYYPPTVSVKKEVAQTTSEKKVAIAPVKKTEPIAKKETACTTAGTTNTIDKNTNLTASANFGWNGFMPKNIFQWFLLAIMVLLIVFLVRKIYRKDQEYKLAPLKHA